MHLPVSTRYHPSLCRSKSPRRPSRAHPKAWIQLRGTLFGFLQWWVYRAQHVHIHTCSLALACQHRHSHTHTHTCCTRVGRTKSVQFMRTDVAWTQHALHECVSFQGENIHRKNTSKLFRVAAERNTSWKPTPIQHLFSSSFSACSLSKHAHTQSTKVMSIHNRKCICCSSTASTK